MARLELLSVAEPFRRVPGGRGRSEAELRHQLVWFTRLRLAVITAALFTTLLLDFVIKLVAMATIRTTPLYAVLAAAYVVSFVDLGVQAFARSPRVIAAVQFGGDIVVETGLLYVLGTEGAVALLLAFYFLTTFLACSYLSRAQGALFATGALALQVAVFAASWLDVLPDDTLMGHDLREMGVRQAVRDMLIFMFTFYATAWLVSSRAERLRAMGDRLESVTDELHELQAFNEHVIRSMNAGLVTTLLDGRITFTNAAAQRVLGAANADLRGSVLHEILGWEDHFSADVLPLSRGAASHCFEREAGGNELRRSLRVVLSRLEDRVGDVLGLLFLLEDVTELRQLEGEVRTKEKMAAIGEMAAGIAHEIRNPLASISGSVQMLQRSLRLAGDQGRLMEIVLKESSRLDHTIREFLDFARPRPAAPRPVDLAEVARDTVTLLRHSEEVKPHHELRGPAVKHVEGHADPDQLRQVIWNLCKNALRAMPGGGVMTVDVRGVGAEVLLTVEDTGLGISAETRSRAFQPLSGDFVHGMGLGLAIVYRIVKDHGGNVSIESEVGRGTRVAVRLPAGERTPSALADRQTS